MAYLTKQVLREKVLKTHFDEKQKQKLELKINQKTIEIIKNSDKYWMASYCAFPHEVNSLLIMEFWKNLGKGLCLPTIDTTTDTLSFFAYKIGDNLSRGKFNIFEPEVKIIPIIPDLILVPLVACTFKGDRLGHGYGYYDRTLQLIMTYKKIITFGLAYPNQVLDFIPQDQNDIALDHIITVD